MTAVAGTGRHAMTDPSARTDVLPVPGSVRTSHAVPRTVPPAGLGPSALMPPPYSPFVTPSPVTPPARAGMRWGWLVLGVVGAVLAVAVLAAFAGAHRTADVSGTVTVYGMNGAVSPGASCTSTAEQGAPVSIYDASNRLVGSASLTGYGTARNTWNTYSYSGYADSCEFAFTASGVSMASDFYRIAVGSGQNQGVSFTREQLESGTAGVTLR